MFGEGFIGLVRDLERRLKNFLPLQKNSFLII